MGTEIEQEMNQENSLDDLPGSSVDVSRDRAASRVLWGCGLTTIGGAFFGIGAFVSSLPFNLMAGAVIGGLSLAGVGLAFLGSAALHLFRFGRARPTLILGATAGIGLSVGLGALALAAPLFVGHSLIMETLIGYLSISVFGLSAFIVLLVLGAVIRWVLGFREVDTVSTAGAGIEDAS